MTQPADPSRLARNDASSNADDRRARSNLQSPQQAFRQLCRARDLLADVGSMHLGIADAAREANLSLFHFIRRFARVFGETPHRFRTRERLKVAQGLLARECSVTEACLHVGFSSVGSFSTLFAREVGMSPAAYRRSLRRTFLVPDWTPHPPNCLLWIGGVDASAIFEKTPRRR